jgi:hypothetical protein
MMMMMLMMMQMMMMQCGAVPQHLPHQQHSIINIQNRTKFAPRRGYSNCDNESTGIWSNCKAIEQREKLNDSQTLSNLITRTNQSQS